MELHTVLPLSLGLGLVFIHYYSEVFHHHRKRLAAALSSFVAGISVSYLFLYLLPELAAGVKYLDRLLFFFLLTGFTLFHLVEKYIYQHEQGDKKSKNLSHVHILHSR